MKTKYINSYHIYQRNKRKLKLYQYIPLKKAETIPWGKLYMDNEYQYNI